MLYPGITKGQMVKTIQNLPTISASDGFQLPKHSVEEKRRLLSTLLKNDSVQFVVADGDPDNPTYYPFSPDGVFFVDLDEDEDLDLLYSGQSGWHTTYSTKIFYQDKGQLQYDTLISGGILHLDKNKNGYSLYNIQLPCCDSYTSVINSYTLTPDHNLQFNGSISFMGVPYLDIPAFHEAIALMGLDYLKGMPDFDKGKEGVLKNGKLYGSKDDFNGTSAYFKERNDQIRDSLYNGHFIELINLNKEIKVHVLDEKFVDGKKWSLVITEPISSAPESLYEGSTGDKRRFIGWAR